MSGIENKVEEPVVAPEATATPVIIEPAAVEAAPATSEPATTEATTETPAAEPVLEEASATETPVTEQPKEEAKEIAPISEGTLGYKAPGLLKSLRFSKKFFWLGDEAVEQKHLANYLRGEKPEVGNKNGAWALQTGKGLLFFSKSATEKTTPGGIINLAEISDVTNDGAVEFYFQYQSHKHSFQAASAAERDSWVAALSAAATEAKGNAEGITTSDSYKEHLATLGKGVAASPAAKKEEKAEDKEEKKEEKAAEAADKKEVKEEKKEEKDDRKSRSQSRKRTSIFGAFNKKKEEPKAVEETAAAAPVETAATESTEAAPVEVAAPVPAEETAPVEAVKTTEATPAPTEPVRPAASKRTSIFGQLQSRFSNNKKEETAPAVPAKDEAAPETSDAAPVIPAVETETALSADINSPATVPTETTTPEVTEAAPAEATPKAEKRKSALPFGLGGKNSPGLLSRFGTKKNKKSSSTEEPTTPVTSEKPLEAAPVAEEPATEIPVTNGEVPSEPTPAAQTAPVVSATA